MCKNRIGNGLKKSVLVCEPVRKLVLIFEKLQVNFLTYNYYTTFVQSFVQMSDLNIGLVSNVQTFV